MKTLLLFIVLTTQTGCVELLNPPEPLECHDQCGDAAKDDRGY